MDVGLNQLEKFDRRIFCEERNEMDASTSARSCSLLIGLPLPFSFLTDASVFMPTISTSPRLRAAFKKRTWPTCKMSKQPFVVTIVFPAAFKSPTALAAANADNTSPMLIALDFSESHYGTG